MIYYYKHKSVSDYTPEEISMLGDGGIERFARENNLSFAEVAAQVRNVEAAVSRVMEECKNKPVTGIDLRGYKTTLKKSVDTYIDYFNNNAVCEKQAFVVLGNASSGKSLRAKNLEKETRSITIDSDRFKMGEKTPRGNFEGFSSLYKKPHYSEIIHEICSDANKLTIDNVSSTGMNIVLPKATSSLAKLEKQLEILLDRGYDIHLILVEAPLDTCADRNYYRFLVKQYAKVYGLDEKGTLAEAGRFIPVDTIKFLHDGSYATFFDAYQQRRYKSFKAIYNDKKTPKGEKIEIDLDTMQPIQ